MCFLRKAAKKYFLNGRAIKMGWRGGLAIKEKKTFFGTFYFISFKEGGGGLMALMAGRNNFFCGFPNNHEKFIFLWSGSESDDVRVLGFCNWSI